MSFTTKKKKKKGEKEKKKDKKRNKKRKKKRGVSNQLRNSLVGAILNAPQRPTVTPNTERTQRATGELEGGENTLCHRSASEQQNFPGTSSTGSMPERRTEGGEYQQKEK